MQQFKQHISIALTTAFVFGMLWQTFTIINFYINRETITEEHCVNKNKPESNCKGQCHLEKQLEVSTPDQEETKKTNGSTKTSFLLLVFASPQHDSGINSIDFQKPNFKGNVKNTESYHATLLDPPQMT